MVFALARSLQVFVSSVRSKQGTPTEPPQNENKGLIKQEIVPQGAYLLFFCARLLLFVFAPAVLTFLVFRRKNAAVSLWQGTAAVNGASVCFLFSREQGTTD